MQLPKHRSLKLVHQDVFGEEKLLPSVTSSGLSSLFTHRKVQLWYGVTGRAGWWGAGITRVPEESCSEGTSGVADLHITKYYDAFKQVDQGAFLNYLGGWDEYEEGRAAGWHRVVVESSRKPYFIPVGTRTDSQSNLRLECLTPVSKPHSRTAGDV